jgi:ribosome biogenesis protein MAK21
MIMARRKTNSAKGIKESSNAHNGSIPSFDENALSALTAKIEKGFDAGKSQRREPNQGQNWGNETKIQTHAKTQSKTTPTALVRGTKRDIRGIAKIPGNDIGTSGGPSRQKNGKGNDARAVLLREILALGGTEEDLDLVADAVSDEEDIDSSGPPDKSFRKDLANFVARLGIEGGLDEGDSGGSDEEEEIGGGWEDASDSNTSAGFDGGADAESALATALRNLPSDDPKRLVSSISAGATGRLTPNRSLNRDLTGMLPLYLLSRP